MYVCSPVSSTRAILRYGSLDVKSFLSTWWWWWWWIRSVPLGQFHRPIDSTRSLNTVDHNKSALRNPARGRGESMRLDGYVLVRAYGRQTTQKRNPSAATSAHHFYTINSKQKNEDNGVGNGRSTTSVWVGGGAPSSRLLAMYTKGTQKHARRGLAADRFGRKRTRAIQHTAALQAGSIFVLPLMSLWCNTNTPYEVGGGGGGG